MRIAPALVVCLLVTAAPASLFIPSAWLSQANATTALAAFFGLSNFVLAGAANDYFARSSTRSRIRGRWPSRSSST
jgi:peptidoglycan/LPS O-acetylase OafA/YrhL